jgi:hypothetical protein
VTHIEIINIKNCKALLKKSCYRPCSHRSKTAKIKRERGRERDSGNSSSYEAYNTIACSSSSSSSSSSSNKQIDSEMINFG